MTVIGIDFGTANAMVGYFDGHAARIIPNAWGAELTPTVVNVAPPRRGDRGGGRQSPRRFSPAGHSGRV